jgi:uncharacterized protein YndB with AHSA1/START domain
MSTRAIAFAVFAIFTSSIVRAQPATQPSTRPARGDTLVVSAVIDAPADEIFECFTTGEGFAKAVGVAQAKVDFRVGGQIRSAYAKETDLDTPKAIVNTILAYVPSRLLVIKPTAPEGAPDWLQAICESGWNVLEFTPIGDERTRVTITGLGYKDGPLFDKAYSFFKQGNEWTLKHMQESLGHAGLKERTDRAWAKLKNQVGGDWICDTTRDDGSIFRAHAHYDSALDGQLVVSHGRLGDASGMHDHAMMVASINPESGAIRFDEFLEGSRTARGFFVTPADDRIELPLNFESPGKPTTTLYAIIRFVDNDTYRFNVYASRARAMSASAKPIVDVTYKRVGELPEQFKKMAAAK